MSGVPITDKTPVAEALRLRAAKAAECLKPFLQDALPNIDDAVHYIRQYIFVKLALEESVETTDNLETLMQLSIDAAAKKYGKDGMQLNDLSPGCTGLSTASAKKALLLASLQNSLSVTLAAVETSEIETVYQLTNALLQALHKERH